MIKKLLCAMGLHDIQYVKKPKGASREYVDLRSDTYAVVSIAAQSVIHVNDYFLIKRKYHNITEHDSEYSVCLREECNYVKDMESVAAVHLERLKKKLEKKYHAYIHKDQRASAALEKALKISNAQKNDGALSVATADGSLSIAEDGQLAIHDVEES